MKNIKDVIFYKLGCNEVFCIGVLFLILSLFGCANIHPEYDSAGNITGATSYGFLRTIRVEQVKPDGSKIVLETQSNTGEVLGGVNQMMGTAVGAARDLMP
jgi:hypothetical protein